MIEKPCIYKHSCGWEICMLEDCPEYIAKTKENKYYGTDGGKMDQFTATEQAYRNGYAKGFEDGKRDSEKRGRWIIHSIGSGENATNFAECSYCHVCGSPQWKVCPVCETKMEV